MTAADALRSAEPPVDDGGIDKALADLDVKIWTWTDAMLSARAAIKRSLAHKEIFSRGGEYSLDPDAAGVAPAMAASGAVAPPAFEPAQPAPPASVPRFDAPGQAPAFGSNWGQTPAQPQQPAPSGQASASSGGEWAPAGPMQWPSAESTNNTGSGDVVPLAWPSVPSQGGWNGSEKTAAALPAATQGKSSERIKKPAPPRLSPEEAEARAERAAREEAMLAALDETSARRVRLLRRLDPDADIEQLIEKASQTQSRESEKPSDKAPWWRRK